MTQDERPKTESGREVRYFVKITCTDRGQHKRVLLTTARQEINGDHGMSRADRFGPPDRAAGPASGYGRDSYTFSCPLCDRTPEVQSKKWWAAVDEVARVGGRALDISMLGF